jgi:hypothetical protein
MTSPVRSTLTIQLLRASWRRWHHWCTTGARSLPSERVQSGRSLGD